MNNSLAALLTSNWMMDPVAAQAELRDMLERREIPDTDPRPAVAMGYNLLSNTPQGATRLLAGYTAGMLGYDPTSVATVQVIYMKDSLTPWAAEWKADQLRAAYANESVLGIVVRMNCQGGTDQAAYMLSDVLAERNKPVIFHTAYGHMNSSGYWVAACGDYVMASRTTDRIGGVGIYMPFMDSSGYFEKMGYAMRDIYAPESTEKNAEYRAAQAGNDKPYEAYASKVRGAFWAHVQAMRGDKLNTKASDPSKGATYNGDEALTIGLIDEIGSFERAVEKCIELALVADTADDAQASAKPLPATIPPPVAPQANSQSTDTMNFFNGYVKLDALASLKGVAPEAITPDKIVAVNAELKAAGIGLALISETDFAAGVQAAGQVTALQNQLTTVQGSVKTLTEERDKALEKVAEFGGQPGEVPSNPIAKTDPTPSASGTASAADIIAQLPSMKALDGNPFFN